MADEIESVEDASCHHGEQFSRINLDDRAAGSVTVRRAEEGWPSHNGWDVPLPAGAEESRYRYVCPNCLGVFDHDNEWVCAYVDLSSEEQA